jgi:hypothetical protein
MYPSFLNQGSISLSPNMYHFFVVKASKPFFEESIEVRSCFELYSIYYIAVFIIVII